MNETIAGGTVKEMTGGVAGAVLLERLRPIADWASGQLSIPAPISGSTCECAAETMVTAHTTGDGTKAGPGIRVTGPTV